MRTAQAASQVSTTRVSSRATVSFLRELSRAMAAGNLERRVPRPGFSDKIILSGTELPWANRRMPPGRVQYSTRPSGCQRARWTGRNDRHGHQELSAAVCFVRQGR